MNRNIPALIVAAWCSLFAVVESAPAQGTAFTYQGQLSSSGGPANGNYDLSFALYAAGTGGAPVITPVTNLDTPVTNGLFTVTLNFGSGIFTGGVYWLQIAVQTNEGAGFVTLSPRQQVTPAPYAMYAASAGTASVAQSVAAANISGPIALTQLAGNVITNSQSSVILSGTFNGNGGGLTSLNASNLASGTVADARLSTNVDLLNANQTLTGSKTFSNSVSMLPPASTSALTVTGNTTGGWPAPVAAFVNTNTSANASPALRVVASGTTSNGVLSVSAEGTGLIAQFGNSNVFVSALDTNGNWTANSYSGNGSNLSNLNASNLTSGTVALQRLPASVVTNNDTTAVTLTGTFSGTISGNGGNLTNLNASNLTNGTVADARLASDVALLDKSQIFSVEDTFNVGLAVNANGGNPQALTVSGSVPGGFGSPLALFQNNNTSGNTSPAFRAVGFGNSPNGVLSVSSEGTGLLAQFGNSGSFVSQLDINGNWTANSYTGIGSGLSSVNAITLGGNDLSSVSGESGLSLGTNIFLNGNPIYLRSDMNHGLAYNGFGITNFPSAAVQPDGPVLWGYTGGALATLSAGPQAALTWNASSVNVSNNLNVTGNLSVNNITASGNLSANNTPGVNWSQGVGNFATLVSGATQLDACGNLKPAAGFFVIIASVELSNPQNDIITLTLYDTTSGNVVLNSASCSDENDEASLCLSWVEPINTVGGYENFATVIDCEGSGIELVSHNLTVMYFPRQND
jgi:hypothetical protein